jgi:hypothetical protein
MGPETSDRRRAVLVVAAIVIVAGAAFAVAGLLSGDDESDVVVTETVPPAAEEASKDKKKQKDGEAGAKDSGAPAGGPCGSRGSISQLRVSGGTCDQASAVANAWEKRQDDCSTIDNPNSPEGYKRTCTVSGYRCTATRDTRSDKRFVSCSRDATRIKFTFLA